MTTSSNVISNLLDHLPAIGFPLSYHPPFMSMYQVLHRMWTKEILDYMCLSPHKPILLGCVQSNYVF